MSATKTITMTLPAAVAERIEELGRLLIGTQEMYPEAPLKDISICCALRHSGKGIGPPAVIAARPVRLSDRPEMILWLSELARLTGYIIAHGMHSAETAGFKMENVEHNWKVISEDAVTTLWGQMDKALSTGRAIGDPTHEPLEDEE